MAKKGPNHQHHRDDPAKRTSAPNRAENAEAPGMSGQGSQEHDAKGRQGQFGDAGDAPLIKK